MKMHAICLSLAVVCLLACASANAQYRFELTPFAGYETSGTYPVFFSSGSGQIDQLRLNGTPAYGAFVDYAGLSEYFQPEFMWNHNNTSYSAHDVASNSYVSGWHSDVDQFQFGGIFMLRSSEARLRPYFGASLGFTHEANNNANPDRTAFSFSAGGGIKYELSRHIALRGDIRYLPTYANHGISCDSFYGCYRSDNYLNRANAVGGIVFKF